MLPKKPLLYSGVLALGLSLPTSSAELGKYLEIRADYQKAIQEHEVAKEEAWQKVLSRPPASKERIKGITDWHNCLFKDFMFYERNSLRERLNLLKGSVELDIGSKKIVISYDLPGPVSAAEYKKLTHSTREIIKCWSGM